MYRTAILITTLRLAVVSTAEAVVYWVASAACYLRPGRDLFGPSEINRWSGAEACGVFDDRVIFLNVLCKYI